MFLKTDKSIINLDYVAKISISRETGGTFAVVALRNDGTHIETLLSGATREMAEGFVDELANNIYSSHRGGSCVVWLFVTTKKVIYRYCPEKPVKRSEEYVVKD